MKSDRLWQTDENPVISAAMIVKDEAENLEACLRSIQQVVDEVVVLDTGSTDQTKEIARRLGARVHEELWQNDFSLHRNHSIELCRGRWVFIIDGDEVLRESGDLRELLVGGAESAGADAVIVRVDTCTGDQVREQLFSVRAFRRDSGRFEYPIHNQLIGITSAVPSSAVIRSEYSQSSKDRSARAIPALLRLVEECPEDPHGPFYLAMTYRGAGDAEQTRKWARRATELAPENPLYAVAWVWLVYSTFAVDGADAAEAVLKQALGFHSGLADLHHAQMATAAFRWSQAAKDPGPYMFQPQASTRYLPNIAEACRLLGFPFTAGKTEAPQVDRSVRAISHRKPNLKTGD